MSAPQKYRKKPVVITARQLDMSDYDEACEIVGWSNGRAVDDGIEITTIHGDTAIARDGDWIVAEPEPGRFYPVKPDIFAATYEAVSGDEPSTPVEINTPAVRQAIASVVHEVIIGPDTRGGSAVAAQLAGRIFVLLDRASAALPLDAEALADSPDVDFPDQNPTRLHDLLDQAWGVIANAGMKTGRGWDSEHPEWVNAAERWREAWGESRGITPGTPRTVEEIAAQQAESNASADASLAAALAVSA